ncbi:MAG: hypothetical protein QM541_00890 [Flavobacterium sp.]|nr:hypothetical protein [Flavobacterium sp.]
MDLAILYRGSSKDNIEAKNILREINVKFVEVFSEDKSHLPVFCSSESAYPYKGINEIREYASSVKFSMDEHQE